MVANIPGSTQNMEVDGRIAEGVRPLSTILSHVVFIAKVVLGSSFIFVVILLLLPNYYQSTTTLLPGPAESLTSLSMGLSSLASLAGVSVGNMNPEQSYPAIIKSEAVLKRVIYQKYPVEGQTRELNLIEYWEIEADTPQEDYERALEKLRDQLKVAVDRETFVVSVSISTRDANLSAAIVNSIASNLDSFVRTKRTSTATEQRKWIETRLAQVEEDLKKSEEALKVFKEKNRRVIDSPELILELERLTRDVMINSTLYTELKKQIEIVKIEEIKNIPVISVMDEGRPAALHSSPRRGLLLIGFMVLMTAIVCTGVVLATFRKGEVDYVISHLKSSLATGLQEPLMQRKKVVEENEERTEGDSEK